MQYPCAFVFVTEAAKEEKPKEPELQGVPPQMSIDKPKIKDLDLNTIEITWEPARLPKMAKKVPIK